MNAPPPTPPRTDWRILLVAVALLVGFAFLTFWMLATTDSDETQWTRQAFVFGSVEAIVFTAVGWLFGREVHRSEAQSAKNDATLAKTDAAEERKMANASAEALTDERIKGNQVAAGVRVATANRGGGGGPTLVGRKDGGNEDVATSPMDALRAMVDELYPE